MYMCCDVYLPEFVWLINNLNIQLIINNCKIIVHLSYLLIHTHIHISTRYLSHSNMIVLQYKWLTDRLGGTLHYHVRNIRGFSKFWATLKTACIDWLKHEMKANHNLVIFLGEITPIVIPGTMSNTKKTPSG